MPNSTHERVETNYTMLYQLPDVRAEEVVCRAQAAIPGYYYGRKRIIAVEPGDYTGFTLHFDDGDRETLNPGAIIYITAKRPSRWNW
jgi:hypothetical protein